jgi:dGTPase
MFAKVYRSETALIEERKVKSLLRGLFDYFMEHPGELPADLRQIAEEETTERAVCDYIAGMTDPYAVNIYREKLIPGSWQTL